jgi:HPt (histidine-containing phosphotransfer) domain-containing protein
MSFDTKEAMEQSGGHWSVDTTLEHLGGDETLLKEVLDIFLAEAPKHMAALRVAVMQGIAATVETTAHTLKGELGYMGIPEISRMAAQLEDMGRSENLAGALPLLAQFEASLTPLIATVRQSVAR